MYALVESGSITKYFNYPKGFTLGDLQYSGDIFIFRYNGSKWLEDGRNLALTL